jgi:hypothetical protein
MLTHLQAYLVKHNTTWIRPASCGEGLGGGHDRCNPFKYVGETEWIASELPQQIEGGRFTNVQGRMATERFNSETP